MQTTWSHPLPNLLSTEAGGTAQGGGVLLIRLEATERWRSRERSPGVAADSVPGREETGDTMMNGGRHTYVRRPHRVPVSG